MSRRQGRRRRAGRSAVPPAALVAAGGVAARWLRRRRHPHRRPLFARGYGVLSRRAERGPLGVRRRALLAAARGRVLDVGAGPGGGFAGLPDGVGPLVALEPDPAMVDQARRRAAASATTVVLVRGVAERLPFADGSFDTVVVALVLCTVDDPQAAAAEIHRVLRPGGRLLIMEHVRADDDVLARWQDRLQPLWTRGNGGCRPNRPTLDIIRGAGFSLEAMEAYGSPALPHVQAVAVRGAAAGTEV